MYESVDMASFITGVIIGAILIKTLFKKPEKDKEIEEIEEKDEGIVIDVKKIVDEKVDKLTKNLTQSKFEELKKYLYKHKKEIKKEDNLGYYNYSNSYKVKGLTISKCVFGGLTSNIRTGFNLYKNKKEVFIHKDHAQELWNIAEKIYEVKEEL